MTEPYPRDGTEPEGIVARDDQRLAGEIGSENVRIGTLAAEADGDAPRARTEIEHAGRERSGARAREGDFDEDLGIGARNQDSLIDTKGSTIELAHASQIGDRLSGSPALVKLSVTRELVLGERTGRVDDEPDAIDSEDECEQNLRVQARRVIATRAKIVRCPLKDAPDGPDVAFGH